MCDENSNIGCDRPLIDVYDDMLLPLAPPANEKALEEGVTNEDWCKLTPPMGFNVYKKNCS